jgi:hypothetical protein
MLGALQMPHRRLQQDLCEPRKPEKTPGQQPPTGMSAFKCVATVPRLPAAGSSGLTHIGVRAD